MVAPLGERTGAEGEGRSPHPTPHSKHSITAAGWRRNCGVGIALVGEHFRDHCWAEGFLWLHWYVVVVVAVGEFCAGCEKTPASEGGRYTGRDESNPHAIEEEGEPKKGGLAAPTKATEDLEGPKARPLQRPGVEAK